MLDIVYLESRDLLKVPWLKRSSVTSNDCDIFSDGVWVYVRKNATMPWYGIPQPGCLIQAHIPEED